jgi:adenosylhomocysteinase
LGRKEIELAEAEMPGLMALRAEYKDEQPCRFSYCWMFAHDNPNCGFDRNIDRSWAEVTWSSCNIFSTQDQAAAAIAAGIQVYA